MYDTDAPRPIYSDADGFTDLVRRFDRAEPWRSGAAARELDFNEELHFGERGAGRKRARALRPPRSAGRVKAAAAAAPKRAPELRLVPPAPTDENLAVEDAQMHARSTSMSWKEYVENMDLFLDGQLDPGAKR